MDAIRLLKIQHRDVEDLFEELLEEGGRKTREKLCARIEEALAVHAAVEEEVFYAACREARGEDDLRQAVEAHLSAKRVLADIVDAGVDDPQFDARMKKLLEQVEHHADEEEGELFPEVQKLLSRRELEELGAEMEKMADRLERDEPRIHALGNTHRPAVM